MHRDIRADVQAFGASSRANAQLALDRWRQEFNHVRPHEALAGKVPADLYRSGSNRTLAPIRHVYPAHWLVRRVYGNGVVCVNNDRLRITRALLGRSVALEPIGPFTYRVWFGEVDLGEVRTPLSTAEMDRGCEHFLERRKVAV